jgi:phosphomannomutase
MLAALHVMAELGRQDVPLSALLRPFDRYRASGEINSTVTDAAAKAAEVEAAYAGRDGVTLDHLDGLTVSAADWWFNLRPSNTEPLLRLNAEAVDEPTMATIRDDVLALVRGT